MSWLVGDTKRFYKAITITLTIFVFILSTMIVLSAPIPIGSDPYFHLEIARLYGTGNFTGAFDYITTVNQIPFYPPLYHALLIPIAISPYPLEGIRILEILAMPLTFTAVIYLLWKFTEPKAAFIAGLVLLGSWSFIDAAFQARPETLDLMLYPVMLLAILSAKKKTFVISAVATIYNHGVMAVINIWGWLPKLFKAKKTWFTSILMITAISSPILILTALYFGGGWSMWATTAPQENPQETLFWTTPSWIPFYAGLTLMGFIFLVKNFRNPKTELESYLKYGMLGNLVMLPLWADRWLQYSTIPLACLVGIEVARWHGSKLYVTLAVVALGAWIYISFFLWNSIIHNWFIPGAFVHQ